MSPNKSQIPKLADRRKKALQNELDHESKSRSEAPSEKLSSLRSTQIGDSLTDVTPTPSARTRRASPYDKDFYEQVLEPRGIAIVESRDRPVWDHFGTEEPN